jgi:hypothetical protein
LLKNSKLESELGLVSKLGLGIHLQLEPHPKLELTLKLKLYKFLFFIISKIIYYFFGPGLDMLLVSKKKKN